MLGFGSIAAGSIADSPATGGGGSVAYSLLGAAGSYAITGQTVAFKVARLLSGSSGSYALNGQSGTFAYVQGTGFIAYALSGSYGDYLLTGFAASFSVSQSSAKSGVSGKRRRCVVEINGQMYFVRNEQEALALIDATRDEIKAEIKAESPKLVKVVQGKPVAKPVKVRVVTGSDTLKHHAAAVTQDLRGALKAMIDRLVIEAMQEQDDEDVLLLL